MFTELLNKLLKGELHSDKERASLYTYVNSYVLGLASKHYGQKQDLRLHNSFEKQQARVLIFYEYVLENKDKTPEYLIKSFNCRFLWVELIVECRVNGIKLFDDGTPVTQQITSSIVRHIILGIKLVRRFIEEHGTEPTYEEICIEYIKYRLRRGKQIKFSAVDHVVSVIVRYLYCKAYTNPLEKYDEEYYRAS